MSSARWFVGFAILLLTSAHLRAQEAPVRTISFEGPEVFCHILHHRKFQALDSVQEMMDRPGDTLLIVLGDPRHENVADALRQLRDFQKQGGSVLISTRDQFQHNQVPVRVTGQEIYRRTAFNAKPICPWLTYPNPQDNKPAGDRLHPVFHLLLQGIATNWPSDVVIDNAGAALVPLLDFPIEERPLRSGVMTPIQHYIVGSPRDTTPTRRELYIAGHGIFMNGMMLQKRTDNFAFAVNVIDWLGEAPQEKQRSRALLIVDGTIVKDFDMKLTPPPPPMPMPTRAIINRLLRNLEEEGFFHHVAQMAIGDNMPRVLLAIAIGVTLLLLLYGIKKLTDGRQQSEAVPRLIGAAPAPGLTPAAIKTQQNATLRHANLWREARQLAQAWFKQELGVDPEEWTSKPRVDLRAQSFFWMGAASQHQANLAVRLARATKGTVVTQQEFVELVQAVRCLSEALREGRVTLHLDGKPVRKSA